jgi:molybdopterin converting factor small subunit
MNITLNFYSYFKELAGCDSTVCELPSGARIADLLSLVENRFPKIAAMQKSMLIAVGVEYQNREYLLKAGDEVSLFPPVQGG